MLCSLTAQSSSSSAVARARARRRIAGERVTDLSITAAPRSVARAPLHAPLSASGWVNIGGRRY